jgi:hypothetical protein
MFTDLVNHPNLENYDLSSLKYGGMGGSPCSPELVKIMIQKLGINVAVNSYSLSDVAKTEKDEE